ncbi:MAG: hypothetical protein K8J08_02365, partial [Thermoanaerobaculia bacterium]|nr:hypothetical protein [Thermoanaerobaculia bacterium]
MREARGASFTLVLVLTSAVALAALLPFLSALDYGFVRYDDYEYVVENPVVRSGLHADSVRWAFTTFTLSNWHPLTWISYLLDVELFDVDAKGYHLVSLLLHALNVALLFLLLYRLTAATFRSAAVALLWGVHPLRVESVVWISERKDVLSSSFALLAIFAYVCYVERRSRRWMALTALLMALGLMVKPMLVTLPI